MSKKQVEVTGGLRTEAERNESGLLRDVFKNNPSPWEVKMDNFPKYARRQTITRLLALYELFKIAMPRKARSSSAVSTMALESCPGQSSQPYLSQSI